jgi:hypothetical protein
MEPCLSNLSQITSDTSREVPEDYHTFLGCILQHPDNVVDYETFLMMS